MCVCVRVPGRVLLPKEPVEMVAAPTVAILEEDTIPDNSDVADVPPPVDEDEVSELDEIDEEEGGAEQIVSSSDGGNVEVPGACVCACASVCVCVVWL